MERAKGFEPSTPTLARLCSTPELRPLGAGETGKAGETRHRRAGSPSINRRGAGCRRALYPAMNPMQASRKTKSPARAWPADGAKSLCRLGKFRGADGRPGWPAWATPGPRPLHRKAGSCIRCASRGARFAAAMGPHRLEAQDGALSRRKPGFESPWGRQLLSAQFDDCRSPRAEAIGRVVCDKRLRRGVAASLVEQLKKSVRGRTVSLLLSTILLLRGESGMLMEPFWSETSQKGGGVTEVNRYRERQLVIDPQSKCCHHGSHDECSSGISIADLVFPRVGDGREPFALCSAHQAKLRVR
jgi:hypothetical protein